MSLGDTGATPKVTVASAISDISPQANQTSGTVAVTAADNAAPVLMTVATTIADNATVGVATDKISVVFSESVTGTVATEFVLGSSGNDLTGSVISGSGSTYVITLGTVTGTPAAGADLVFTQSATVDAAGNNAASGTIGTAEITYGATIS